MVELINKQIQVLEAELEKYNELLKDCTHNAIRYSLCKNIEIKEACIGELYGILNKAIAENIKDKF